MIFDTVEFRDSKPRFMRDNSYPGRMRTRIWRRRFVAGIGIGWALTIVAALDPVRQAVPFAWTAMLALTAACALLLTLATRNLTNMVDAWADERDRSRRDHATRLAYWTFAAPFGGMIGFVAAWLQDHAGEPPTLVVEGGVFTAVLLVGWTFCIRPTAFRGDPWDGSIH